jgi:hypothetical protein
MPYTKTTWLDEVPATSPIKYKISQASSGDVATDATIELVTSVTEGTPINAVNLNKIEAGIEDAQATADAAVVKPTNPTTTSVLQQTTAGVTSLRAIKQTVQRQLADGDTDVDSTILSYFFIPSTLNGMNLVRAQAMVLTSGTTGATTIQIKNQTKYPSNDSLSTPISIASGSTVGTVGTINTSYDDVSTNDRIVIYVTGYSTVKALGLFVIMEYQLP